MHAGISLKITLSQFGLKEMNAAVSDLLALSRLTNGFREASLDFFDFNFPYYRLLIDGKRIEAKGITAIDHDQWHRSTIEFCPENAVRNALLDKLQQHVISILDFTLENTDNFSRVPSTWITENPHTFPILISALGPLSKREFADKHKITTASDHAIPPKSAEVIARLFMHSDVESRDRIERNMRSTNEGIVRDLIGKVLFESIVNRAMEDIGLTCVREAENRVLKGLYSDARADFVFPCPETPKAFIEVRKSSANHSSLYANDKCWMVTNWKALHPELLGVFVYAGSWTKPALDALKKIYDYVLPVSESEMAANLIKSHLAGDPTILKRRVRFEIEDCNQ
jgi:hypothetical protein